MQGCTLNIDFSKIINVDISRLMNYGNIFFSNYVPQKDSKFRLANSNLGTAELSIMDLWPNSNVEILHSNLSDLKFSAVAGLKKRILIGLTSMLF